MTKFADMPIGQRNRWIAWANSHDWGGSAARWTDDGSGKMLVSCAACDADGTWSVEQAAFDNPADLRAWAGY